MTIQSYIQSRENFIDDPESATYVNKLKARYESASDADKLKILGVKSAPNAKILTEAEDKSKRESKFAEDSAVNRIAKQFKKDYPGVPFNIDKVAQKRSHLGGHIHKSASFQSGHPDIHIPVAKGGFNSLYIEQKLSDDIFYQNSRILKPGPKNHAIWQSLYHASLREQGNWVMFSISEEATLKIIRRYMEGNPFKQQVFQYYCKPEDHCIFEEYKHFCPVNETPKSKADIFLEGFGL